MLMVHRLISCHDTGATTELTVLQDNVFVLHGHLSEPGIVENMAQTAAAWQGWACRFMTEKSESAQDGTSKIRYLGGIRKFSFFRLPEVGETLTTTIQVKASAGDVTLVSCSSETQKGTVAVGELKISR